MRDEIDLRVEIASSAYVTQSIFEKYMDQVLIPVLESNSNPPGCAKKLTLPFCDNCAAHCSEEILSKLARIGIPVTDYPPHTWHIFQVLDVLLLEVLERAKKYQRRDDSFAVNVDHILGLFRPYEIATTIRTIKSS
jgi:hypothetical protein